MAKKFQPLDYSRGWDDYWRDHPQGYSPQEQMINWSGQLNTMIDFFNKYFDVDLTEYATDVMEGWYFDGRLDDIINEVLFDSKADKTTVNSLIDSLAGIVTKVGDRLSEETDDNGRIHRALALATQNKSPLVFSKEDYVINEPLIIPNGINIDLNGATIQAETIGMTVLKLSGNNTITNGVIDGNNKALTCIEVEDGSQDCNISGVEIMGAFGNTSRGGYGVHIRNNTKRINITDCFIHDIGGFEDGIEGNMVGANRGITVNETEQTKIENCTFDNISGFEDGDAIHVQTTAHPKKIWLKSDVKIINNTFANVYKRAVKIQASGCVVEGNTITSDFQDNINCPVAGVSVFGSDNSIIRNSINFKRSVFGIEIAQGENNTIENNNVLVDVLKLHPNARNANQAAIVVTLGATLTSIVNNFLDSHQYGIYETTSVTGLSILNNTFGENTLYPIDLRFSKFLTIDNNFFNGKPSDAIQLRDVENTVVVKNSIIDSSNGIRFFGAIKNALVLDNQITSDFNKIRRTDVTEGTQSIKVSVNHYNNIVRATATSAGYSAGDIIINTSPTRPKNIKYWVNVGGNSWYAEGQGWGTTAERPSLTTTEGGYTYYDTDLSKIILWNGYSWLV